MNILIFLHTSEREKVLRTNLNAKNYQRSKRWSHKTCKSMEKLGPFFGCTGKMKQSLNVFFLNRFCRLKVVKTGIFLSNMIAI